MANFLLNRMPMINPMNLKVYRGIGRMPAANPTLGGLHLEDIASRLAVIITYYLPQGTLALLAMQRPFETWGRNMAAWLGTFAVAYIAKDQNMGVNGILDLTMVPKGSKFPVKIPRNFTDRMKLYWKSPKVLINQTFGRLFDKFRPNYNYIELFQKAGGDLNTFGIKGDLGKAVYEKPLWAKLDDSELRLFEVRKKHLGRKIAGLKDQLKTVTNEERQQLLKSLSGRQAELKALKHLTKRLGKMKYLSVGVFILLASFFIGITVQQWVFKYIAPLDRKFGLEKTSGKQAKKPEQEPQPQPPKGVRNFAGVSRPQAISSDTANYRPKVVPPPRLAPYQPAFNGGWASC